MTLYDTIIEYYYHCEFIVLTKTFRDSIEYKSYNYSCNDYVIIENNKHENYRQYIQSLISCNIPFILMAECKFNCDEVYLVMDGKIENAYDPEIAILANTFIKKLMDQTLTNKSINMFKLMENI